MSGGDQEVTWWRGVRLDARSAAMMDEVVRLVPHVSIAATQGSYSGGVVASGGTHDGCGAIDLHARTLHYRHVDDLVAAMRRVGWAAWVRLPSQGPWPRHVHGIAVQKYGKGDRGCLSWSAYTQVRAYYEGRNGLANAGRDPGPRDWVGVTWETYQQPKDEPEPEPEQEDDDMIMVEAPDRGVMLVTGGYWHVVTPEERDVMLSLGVRLAKTNARGFDVARAAVSHGHD